MTKKPSWWYRDRALRVTCPLCHAEPGVMCRTVPGNHLVIGAHGARKKEAGIPLPALHHDGYHREERPR